MSEKGPVKRDMKSSSEIPNLTRICLTISFHKFAPSWVASLMADSVIYPLTAINGLFVPTTVMCEPLTDGTAVRFAAYSFFTASIRLKVKDTMNLSGLLVNPISKTSGLSNNSATLSADAKELSVSSLSTTL